jgi:pimeloyl-ACP methyl ester carboxylesterase
MSGRRPVLERRRVIAAVALCAVVCNAACSSGAKSNALASPPQLPWSACGHRLQCTRVSVPLDWSDPNGAHISLAVIRHLVGQPAKRIGSLFFNPGGPGVSGVDTVKAAGTDLDALGGGRFDVVSWDARGTGASTHVRCFSNKADLAAFWDHSGIPTTMASSPAYLRKTAAFARRCGEQSGLLLRHISTADTVRDLEYLRELLGNRPLTYLGWSYGSFLGATYANMFPRRVRAMVLDGVVDPVIYTRGREASLDNSVADTDAIFQKFETLCAAAGAGRCALASRGAVASRVDRLRERLKRTPIPAPSAPGGLLTYGDLLTALFSTLRSPAAWPQLAKDLGAAEDGDGSALENVALQFRSPAGYELIAPASAIGCADSPAPEKPQAWPRVVGRLTRESFIYGPLLGWWLWAPCAAWPLPSADRYIGPWNASTKAPILIVGTRFDPNTPFANAQRLEHLLGNAVLLTHDGYGHTIAEDPSACVERAERAYLVGLAVPARGTVCPSDRVPFTPDFGKAS